ncbi:ATP-binding cassette domain-containing protein [Aurantiacibacter gangjinensis]|uniref:ABC transporter ATP-binding protein n=1 Tax=Aurantiacibacter gangjinensis TaxID=502682 RepID=A0A0G9MKW8_9SPHN|nr:ATP-binding cassette domain-containing protein [Aurantiacibacter gangjinensis]APE27259.1 L-proline glycine betaine ABC transport system permease protein ProV [Aurantiacibacter gangjinensis]KLE31376.1 ABC transporter ATP-binding protein [Aurantiacibacter gangjinensis]
MGDAAPDFLRIAGLSKTYDGARAVDTVSLEIGAGEFVALVGASGSGKSTLLKCVNRLVEPDEGSVQIDGQDTAGLPPAESRRRIGYVFQGIGLFPHLTVAQNIALPSRLESNALSADRIAELLALVELEPEMAQRMPSELSGGQRQRVGVARALSSESHLLLMDEPFGALDPLTRGELGKRVRRLHDQLHLTTVLVTHDMAEALLLATRVLVMDSGRIVADETPAALLSGAGGEVAQALVDVPRAQAEALSGIAR